MKIAVLLVILTTFLPAIYGQQSKEAPTRLSNEVLAATQERLGLEYASYGERKLQLDLYRPLHARQPLPAIICIHGGGWYKGERGSMGKLARALAAQGFVTATISYRLSGEAKFPAAIQDAKAAVRWLRAHCQEFGIKPGAIGVTGLSAGGHLAALLATSGNVMELEGAGGSTAHSSRVQACVAMGAQTDLQSERIRELSSRPQDPFYRPFLGGSQANISQTYALASPRYHLDKGDPPIAFVTGELDDASTRAEAMRGDLLKLGVPTDLEVLPKAPHAFLNQQAAFDRCVRYCAAFFATQLGDQ